MTSELSEDSSFYDIKFPRSLTTSVRKQGQEDYFFELKEKQKQIEDLTYQVKLMAANNQTLNLQNQMQKSEIERLLRFINEQQNEMKKMAQRDNKKQINTRSIKMQLINKMCQWAQQFPLDQQIQFEQIVQMII
ncbi:unnamed protein product (macronuclear) [Paramecium tetraurelia]|uniref:Uncharacterized protein n=2 Tax=Paramecium TaxID=5884 RepID=A0DH16_PARTE|nr:uncharacterized protein GSPATT00002462001 [Paramecium tetraurelia]CAD8140701.1 unnamed protein product [Paramecium octaurelia]CAK82333.1 unnamed protein product [Paramecium tetraurelia]|eukprot:XP_001449730.1 hypothetical protein (macronuclear) [Paramecium tetraurelia strain d4-2]